MRTFGLSDTEVVVLISNIQNDRVRLLEKHSYAIPYFDYLGVVASLKQCNALDYADVNEDGSESFRFRDLHGGMVRVSSYKIELIVEPRDFYAAWHILYDYLRDSYGRRGQLIWASGKPHISLGGSRPPDDLFPICMKLCRPFAVCDQLRIADIFLTRSFAGRFSQLASLHAEIGTIGARRRTLSRNPVHMSYGIENYFSA